MSTRTAASRFSRTTRLVLGAIMLGLSASAAALAAADAAAIEDPWVECTEANGFPGTVDYHSCYRFPVRSLASGDVDSYTTSSMQLSAEEAFGAIVTDEGGQGGVFVEGHSVDGGSRLLARRGGWPQEADQCPTVGPVQQCRFDGSDAGGGDIHVLMHGDDSEAHLGTYWDADA